MIDRFWRGCMCLALLMSLAQIGPGAARAADGDSKPAAATTDSAISWDLSPYRTLVLVRFDSSAQWSTARRTQLLVDLRERVRTTIGGVWKYKIVEAPADLRWDHAADLDKITFDAIFSAASDRRPSDLDKVLLLGLAASSLGGDSRGILVRELDVRTQLWSPPIPVDTSAGGDISVDCARALWSAFRPLVRIDEVTGSDATARIRGGGLPLADRSLELLRPGAMLQPIVRHFDADGRTAKNGVFPIAWTMLRVSQVDGATAKGLLHAAATQPLAIQWDGRTEYLALAVSARPGHSTELTVRARGPGGQPLEDVEALLLGPRDKAFHAVGRTDGRGVVAIESDHLELDIVCLRSGDDPLAQIPLVPGLEPAATVQVEDNGRRFETGDYIAHLRAGLIDLVAQQSVLKSRFRRQFTSGKIAQAKATLAALKSLKTSEAFLQAIETRRGQFKSLTADKLAAAWLEAQLAEIKTLAPKFLIDAAAIERLDDVLAKSN